MSRSIWAVYLRFSHNFAILSGKSNCEFCRKGRCPLTKTKTWILLLGGVFLLSLLSSFFVLRRQPDAAFAVVSSGGSVVKTVNLRENQQFTITSEAGGKNIVTVLDGKIAVTEATCPDHYCMKRGFCASGTDIVCLPNRLVIHFTGAKTVDAAVG